jgi:hypothetical protein
MGVNVYPGIALNNREAISDVLRSVRPDVCIFDRFVTEEQYGHHVRDIAPDCLRVVGMPQ